MRVYTFYFYSILKNKNFYSVSLYQLELVIIIFFLALNRFNYAYFNDILRENK